jgi:hypothetical protein
MGIRVTVEIPEWLFERVAQASSDSDRSIGQVIIDALRDADLAAPSLAERTTGEQLRRAFRDIAPPWTDEDDALMAEVFPGSGDVPLLSHEELRAVMPILDPPLSQTVLDLREDRV